MALPFEGALEPAAHGAAATAPSTHAEPAGHSSHCAWPPSGWKRPAAHRVQTALPAAATLPASQVVGTAEPVLHAAPAGHSAQSDADVRLVALP